MAGDPNVTSETPQGKSAFRTLFFLQNHKEL